MSEILFENPYLVGGIGLIVSIIAWIGWTQSGQPLARNAAILLTLVAILLVCLNVYVKTDREVIGEMLTACAADLQNNRFAEVEKRVHPHATSTVQDVLILLPRLQFREARISRIHAIEVHPSKAAKTAEVRMNVFVDADFGTFSGKSPRWVKLDLEEQNGSWLVKNLEHRDAQHEFVGGN